MNREEIAILEEILAKHDAMLDYLYGDLGIIIYNSPYLSSSVELYCVDSISDVSRKLRSFDYKNWPHIEKHSIDHVRSTCFSIANDLDRALNESLEK